MPGPLRFSSFSHRCRERAPIGGRFGGRCSRRFRKRIVGLIGGVLASLSVASGCVAASGPTRSIDGQRIFDRHCSRCHGSDGRGEPTVPAAKSLVDPQRMARLSDTDIRRVIESGKPPEMPAFGGQFLEPSMKVLVRYIRSLSAPSARPRLPDKSGKQPSAPGQGPNKPSPG